MPFPTFLEKILQNSEVNSVQNSVENKISLCIAGSPVPRPLAGLSTRVALNTHVQLYTVQSYISRK